MKAALSKDVKVETLVLEFSDSCNPEACDLSSILMSFKLGVVKKLFINTIYLTQRTDTETVLNMLK